MLLVGLLLGLRYINESTGVLDAIEDHISTVVDEKLDEGIPTPSSRRQQRHKTRRDTLDRDQDRAQHTPRSNPQRRPNITPDRASVPRGAHIHGDITLLELPRLKEGKENYFVTHHLSSGQVNYSLEYDVSRRHARWVAFTLDAMSSAKSGAKRTDAWQWDPIIPRAYSTEEWFRGSGYSRGHLVASADRLANQEANQQTFFYSNVSPQLQEHNGGIWQRLEQWLQNLGRNERARDMIYVVKGGTIRDDQVYPERIRDKMVVPKYYYMAIVLEKAGRYQGIAFWTEHRRYDHISLRELTMSIDELERRTGLDFFANFPDDLEAHFESMQASDARWPGLK